MTGSLSLHYTIQGCSRIPAQKQNIYRIPVISLYLDEICWAPATILEIRTSLRPVFPLINLPFSFFNNLEWVGVGTE
jgi:hypothetical protein